MIQTQWMHKACVSSSIQIEYEMPCRAVGTGPPPTSLRFLKEYRQSHNHCYKLDKCWLISHLLQQNGHARRLRNKLTTVSYNKTSLVPPTPHPHKIFRLSYGPALKSALLWKLIICSKSGNLTWQSNLHAREPVHYYMKIVVVVVTFLFIVTGISVDHTWACLNSKWRF